MHSHLDPLTAQPGAAATHRTTRTKTQRRTAAVPSAAERGDLATIKAMLGAGDDGAALSERWLSAKRPELVGLRETSAQLRTGGEDAKARKVTTATQRLAHEIEAVEAALLPEFDRAAAASAANAARSPALHCAVSAGHEAIVEALLEAGAPIRSRNRAKRTALHLAAVHNTAAPLMARLLATPDAPVNAGDTVGSTPLHYSAGRDDAGQVVALIAAGAKVDLKNKQLCTPLHVAAAKGAASAAEALLAASASVDAIDASCRTPLHVRAYCRLPASRPASPASPRHHAVFLFIRPRFSLSLLLTMLQVAARDGRSAMVALLLKAGADRTLLDRNGASFATHAQPHVIEDIYGPDGVLSGAPRPGDIVGPKQLTKRQIETAEYAAAEHMAKIGAQAAANWGGGMFAWPQKLASRPGPLRDRQVATWMAALAQVFFLLFLLFAGASFLLMEMGGPGNATKTASSEEI